MTVCPPVLLRSRDRDAATCVGHYLTAGLGPRTALPTARVSRRLGRPLEVAAHPGREPGRRRGASATNVAADRRRAARTPRRGPRRAARPPSAPRSRSPSAASTAAARPASVGRVGARTGRSAPGGSRLTWTRHVEVAAALVGAPAQRRRRSLAPVDGLDDVGVRRDGGRLVALQPADEVPAQVEVGALGGLGLGLLVAVLPHVA